MEGSYTSAERVVRGGFLVAFEGEEMTMDEAARRGLVGDEGKAPKGGRKRKADWLEEAKKLGVPVPANATMEQVKALVEGSGGAPAPGTGDGGR